MKEAATTPISDAAALKRCVGLPGVVALGLGTAVGVSIFSVLTPAVSLAGPAVLLALPITMLPMVIFAFVYAFMGSADPVSGASFEWPRRYVHSLLAFMLSWTRITGTASALVVLTFVLVSYWQMLVPLPTQLGMLAVFISTFLLNRAGIRFVASGQNLMVGLLLVTFLGLIVLSLPRLSAIHFQPFAPHGVAGMLAAIPLMISLFLGIETATEVGGEIERPQRNIPLGMAIAVILVAGLYGLVSLAAIGVLGAGAIAATNAPLLVLSESLLGQTGKLAIVGIATLAIGSSINAIFLIFTRYLQAMAQADMLPRALERVHAASGSPRNAQWLVLAICMFGVLLPNDLTFLFIAVSIPSLLQYGAICYAATVVVRRHPWLHQQAGFRPPPSLLLGTAWLGIFVMVLILWLGLSADWRPYVLLLGWAGLGLAYHLLRRRPSLQG